MGVNHIIKQTWDLWAKWLTWETVPINKHICTKLDYTLRLIKREKSNFLLFENWIFLICYSLSSLHTRMLCAKFNWNWPCGSVEKDFLIKSIYIFAYFFLPLEKGVAHHLNKLKFPLSNDVLFQVRLKSVLWFWRRRWKCEKFSDRRMDVRTNGRQANRNA